MTLAPQLAAVITHFEQVAPASIVSIVDKAKADSSLAFDKSATIQEGQKLPACNLTNALNQPISSAELLSKGPLLIMFYRGSWCPFCNLALHSMQQILPDLKQKGVRFVAISPELPDTSLTTVEKQTLEFEVLSDIGNEYARTLGVVYKQPDSLKAVQKHFGTDLKERNGDDSNEVPVPTTLLVDTAGVVRRTFIEPDFTKRVEPQTVLGWIDSL